MSRRRTGPPADVAEQVIIRDQCCRRCGGIGEQIHHRKPRGAGGTRDPKINSLENLVLLCQRCHERIERNRADAYATGWLVRREHDPAGQLLVSPTGLGVYLTAGGDVVIPTFRSVS